MADSVTFTVTFDHSAEAYEKLHKAIVRAVAETAAEVEGAAKAAAPVATGFLKSSIYADSELGNDYGEGAGTPPQGASLLPPERHERDTQAIVGVASSYGIYVEYGTAKASAQPFLTPAVENARNSLLSRLGRLEEAMK